MKRDGETSDCYASGYALALGHRPDAVVTLAPRPDRYGPARIPVVFVFSGAGKDALREYYQAPDDATLIPARRYKAAVDECFQLARQARLNATMTEKEPHDDHDSRD